MRRRICSLLLAGLMALSSLGTAAFAEGGVLQNGGIAIGASGLCEHHTEHTADCGYTEGIPEQPCNHEHTDDCYAAVEQCVHAAHDESCGGLEDSSTCNHQCSEESGCIVKTLDCRHQHDEGCGYVPAVEGTPCNFVCEICSGAEEWVECTCETLCTEDAINPDCPVCSAEGADLTACKGAAPEAACTCETLCTEDAVNPDCAVCSAEEADLAAACKGEPTEGEILFSDVMTEELQRAFEAGLEDDPEPLTLEDVFAADPQLEARAAANRTFARSAAQPNPGTYVVDKDNENNAGTGERDGDMHQYLKRGDAAHPIEANISIPEGKLPTQSCYIAVRTFDVDWVGAMGPDAYHYEYDKLFVNDVRVGTLTGLQGDWNTSYYEVPLSALREGKNTIRVEIWDCEGAENFADPDPDDLQPTPVIYTPEGSDFQYTADWAVSIDWMQLICDGGSRSNVAEYSLSITNVGVTGDDVQISAQTVINVTHDQMFCQTEYTITDTNGFILGAYHGSDTLGSRKEEFVITMPKGQPDGVYTVTGLLKRTTVNDEILATDQAFFYLENGRPVLKPRLGHTLSPDSWTKEDVAITVEVKDGQGYQDIRISEPTKTVPQNGEYTFDYSYKTPDGEQKSDIYTVKVENIDKTPPVLSCAPVTVMEETDNAQLAAAIRAGITASDGESGLAGEPAFTLTDNFCYTGGEKTVEVTVSDQVGNITKATCAVTVQALPLSIEKPEAVQEGTANRFGLTAKLTHPGSDTITETGFVWGVMQNPTLTINNGKSSTAQAVKNKGGTISVTATDIVDGVNYYCRAYVMAGSKTYYSEQTSFGIGAKQYGTVTIKNNGNSTFTVTRTGGTDGKQTVYYRTVNGSAVGGTHFTHKADKVTIPDGQASAAITIAENNANTAYENNPATAYSNADRTYQVEIYRVDGGAVLGTERVATRTMATSQTVDRHLYDEYAVGIADKTRGDYDKDGLGWSENGQIGSSAVETVAVKPESADYWTHTAQSVHYYLTFEAKEEEQGYQVLQMLPGTTLDTSIRPDKENIVGSDSIDNSRVYYTAMFEHGNNKKPVLAYGTWLSYQFPGPVNFPSESSMTHSIYRSGQSGSYIAFPPDTTSITTGFGGSGSGSDEWNTRNAQHHIQIYDDVEPWLVTVAPLDGSTYRVGDRFTIALVFDEIVDSANSKLNNNDTVQTSWGVAQYAGGMDTNVLYFEGVVKDGATGELQLDSINCADKIKDMCDTEGSPSTGSGGSAGGKVDNDRPTVSISEEKLANGTASAKISAQNYTSLQYTWSESVDTPITGWLSTENSKTVSTRQTSGKWYLHVWGYRSGNGTSAYDSHMFDFGTPEKPISPMPTLSVTANNTDWAKSRDIIVEKTPDDATVSYTGPGVPAAVPVTGDTVTVTENGIYTFVLKSGDETVEKTALVSRIDREAPVLSITGAGETGTIYNQLVMSATASDVPSGIKSVEYVFSDSADAPAEGWQPAAEPVDGKYSFTYTAAEAEQTKKYLHVRATDFAGNFVTKTSDGYTVVKEPEPEELPAIRFTTQLTDWVKGPAELRWEVTHPGAGEWEVEADGKLYPLRRAGDPYPEDPQTTGPLAAPKNGLYQIQVTDKNNNTGSAELIVNWIDSEAPVAEISVPGGWAREKTVTLANITDNRSPRVDETGSVTGYSGSGIKTREYKLSTADGWTSFTGNSFKVTQNGTYQVRLTDNVDNSATYTVEVTGIDTAPPEVQLSQIPDGWQSKMEITLDLSDEGSGVKTVETAFVENKTDTPTDLTEQPIQNDKVTVEAPSGQWYLYYKVTDQVGNSINGYSSLIQVDGTKPWLTVTGGEQGAETVTFTVQATFGVSGGTVTVTEPDGTEEAISGNSYTATKPGSYTFTATSNNANLSPALATKQVFQVSFTEQDELLTQLVVQGGKAVRPADPIRNGYTFTQWQKGGNTYDFETPVNENITLTAAWTLNAPTGLTIETTYGSSTGNNFTYEKGNDLIFTAHPSHDLSTGIDYSYQWYDEDDQPIDGAIEPSYTITDADAGDYRCSCVVTASVGESTSAGTEAEATAAIDRRKLEKPAADDTEFIYSGREQTYTIAPSDYYTVTGDVQTEAGTYTVTVALDDKANCQWADGSTDDLSYTFTIAKLGVEKPTADNTEFVYNGQEQTYTIAPSDYYTVTGNVQTAAGTYTVTVALNDKANYRWADGGDEDLSYTFTIARMGLEKPAEDKTEFVYSGQEQTYTIATSNYYTVTGNIQTQAGTYTVTVALDDKANCQWADGSTDDLSYTFTIAKLGVEKPAADNTEFVYSGQEQTYTIAPSDYYTVTDSVQTQAGTYTVVVTLDDKANYQWADGSTDDLNYTFTIAKLGVEKPATDDTEFVYSGQEQTYTIAPSDYYTVTDNVQTEAGTYTVTVALDDKANCQWADGSTDDLSYTFLIVPRSITATWRNLDMVYNGVPQAPQAASLIGVLEADRGSEKVAAMAEEKEAADEYAVTAKLTGTRAHNYILSNDQVEFSIHPAPVTFQVENNSILYDGQSHTAQVAAQALGRDFESFIISYRSEEGEIVSAPVQTGRYAILAQITDDNYRHSDSAGGEARQVGVLEIYKKNAPALYTITFLPGAEEGINGTLPSLPDSFAGDIFFLPEGNSLSRDGYEFTGWEYDGSVYQPGAEFIMPRRNVTFTAQWVENYDIDGSVVWEGDPPEPAQDILVELKRGNECLAYTTTDVNGHFSFEHILPGVYNLVVSSGDIIRTAKVELIDQNQEIHQIQLPRGKTNSVLDVKDGAPPLVVGNLDNLFTAKSEEGGYTQVYTPEDRKLVERGGKVEIRMEAASAEPEPDSPLGQALDALTQGFVPGLTLNLTMEKSREDANGVSQGETPITESNLLMEVVIPLNGDLQNCRDYLVLREHDGQVDKITAAENQWGEYFTLNTDGTALTISARRFSLYSIVYTNTLPDSGDSDDDDSDRPDSLPPTVTEPSEPIVTPVPEVVPQPSETSDIPQESTDSPSEEEVPQPDESQEPSEEPEVPVSNQPEEPSGPADASNGKPFVLLSAVCAVIAVLLAAFGKSRGRARLAAVLCAAGTVVIVLLTTGWNGIVFVTPWTLPAAVLMFLTGWLTRRGKEVKSEE